MDILGVILIGGGTICSVTGGIGFIVATFRESIWWGLGCLCVPFVELIFLITHWQEAKGPFGLRLVGGVLVILATLLSPELTQGYV